MPWLYQSFSPAEQLAPSISKHSLGWAGRGRNGWRPRRNLFLWQNGNVRASEAGLTRLAASQNLLEALNVFQTGSWDLVFRGSFQGLLLQSYSLNTLSQSGSHMLSDIAWTQIWAPRNIFINPFQQSLLSNAWGKRKDPDLKCSF